MERPPEAPKYALVLWPDAFDHTVPSCTLLECLEDAVARGALVIGREFEHEAPEVDTNLQSNPRRADE